MFELFKFKRNNKNGKAYAIARSNLEFKEFEEDYENDSNNMVNRKTNYQVKQEIDELQTNVRYSNLRIYEKNIKSVKNRRFTIYTLPVVLAMVAGLTWMSPESIDVSMSYDTYKRIETQFSDGKQLIVEDALTYCLSDFNPDFKDDNFKATGSVVSYMNLYLLNDGLGVSSLYTFSDSELLLERDYVKTGSFMIEDIDATNGEEISDIYCDMFDNAVDILIASKRVPKDYRDFLNNFDKDSKSEIVARLIQYEFIERKDVPVNLNLDFARIISSIVAGLYFLIFSLPGIRKPIIECSGLEVNGSRLLNESDYSKQHRFSELPLEYRSAFIAAEKNRILEIAKLADEYLTPESKDMLLTDFEKKLILK